MEEARAAMSNYRTISVQHLLMATFDLGALSLYNRAAV